MRDDVFEFETMPVIKSLRGKCLRKDEAQLQRLIDEALPNSNSRALAVLLKKCADAAALVLGRRLHRHIRGIGETGNTYLGNGLVHMYGRCHCMDEALAAFLQIDDPNVYSYNYLVNAFAQNGHLQRARYLFDRMPAWDVVSWTSIVVGYAKSSQVTMARVLFDGSPEHDIVAWNAMTVAYAQNGHWKDAICLFCRMDSEGVKPDKVSFLNAMVALVGQDMLLQARELHLDAEVRGYDQDVVLASAMIDMYGKCTSPREARGVFQGMPQRNVLSWTAMVTAYAQNSRLKEAKDTFERMPERNLVSWNAMLSAYAQNEHLQEARAMFEAMHTRDMFSWNVMVSSCAHNEQWNECLLMFKRIVVEGLCPDRITFVSAIEACANLQDLALGRFFHSCIDCSRDTVLCNALLSMYGKCGALAEARATFESLQEKNYVTWNSLIITHSVNGDCGRALELFWRMQLEGEVPDVVTFSMVIFTCSHGGMYREGCQMFGSMCSDFGTEPTEEHYICMVDLLARAGQLEQAEQVTQDLPLENKEIVWNVLMSACKTHGEFHRGTRVGKLLVEDDEKLLQSSQYVLLSSHIVWSKPIDRVVASA